MKADLNCPRCHGAGYFAPASRSLGRGLVCTCCVKNGKVSVLATPTAPEGEAFRNGEPSREWLRANLRHAIERKDDANAKALILVARLVLNSEDYDWFIYPEPDSESY